MASLAIEAIVSLDKAFSIDVKRRYVTGVSGGGYGSWHFIGTHPELFAAAIPICGEGNPDLGKNMADIKVWAFHGAKDRNVPVSGSRDMIKAIKKAGGKPRYTEFPNAGHGNESLTLSQCTAALPDRFGNTWVADFNIVSAITPKKQVLNFRLPINEHTAEYDAYLFPLRNGHILSAQKGHLVAFKPENLRPTRIPEPVLLNRLLLNDTTLLLHGHSPPVRLKAEDNSFMVEFSRLSVSIEDHYLYKLEGYDETWREAGSQTYAVYTKLPGGAYVFNIKAISQEGLETPTRTLSLQIDTPFYRTTWFWTLVGLLTAGLVVGFFRYRTRQTAQIYRLQMQATRLEHDKTQIQYQNLINHLNPHFLFNSLTSLNSLILTKPKEASAFLKKLLVIYRYILQNKNSELVSLQDELTFAQHYIDLQTTRFGEALRITSSIDPQYLTRRIVPVTIQNLLENAIKHNIVSDDNPLHIRIYTENEVLFVMNVRQPKGFVETSNKQGLASLKSLYGYLSRREVGITETDTHFSVGIPLL